MKHIFIYICVIVLCVFSTVGVYLYQQQRILALEEEKKELNEELEAAKSTQANKNSANQTSQGAYTSEKGVEIIVTTPASGSKVSSPLEVKGSVPGSWSHEGQFSVRLLDAGGGVLDEEPALIKGDWMTEDMVQFSVTMIFTPSGSTEGSFVLERANPSGMAENNDSLTIPVQF